MSQTQAEAVDVPAASSAPAGSAEKQGAVQNFQLLNSMTEAINGRCAMLGFVAAVASEVVTHQAVWSQLAGRYVDLELVEKPVAAAALGFAMVVALTTMASLAPKLLAGSEVRRFITCHTFCPLVRGIDTLREGKGKQSTAKLCIGTAFVL